MSNLVSPDTFISCSVSDYRVFQMLAFVTIMFHVSPHNALVVPENEHTFPIPIFEIGNTSYASYSPSNSHYYLIKSNTQFSLMFAMCMTCHLVHSSIKPHDAGFLVPLHHPRSRLYTLFESTLACFN